LHKAKVQILLMLDRKTLFYKTNGCSLN